MRIRERPPDSNRNIIRATQPHNPYNSPTSPGRLDYIGLYAPITDATTVAKSLPTTSIVSCELNTQTHTRRLLAKSAVDLDLFEHTAITSRLRFCLYGSDAGAHPLVRNPLRINPGQPVRWRRCTFATTPDARTFLLVPTTCCAMP